MIRILEKTPLNIKEILHIANRTMRNQSFEMLQTLFAITLLFGSFLVLELNLHLSVLLFFLAPLALIAVKGLASLLISTITSYKNIRLRLVLLLMIIACFTIIKLKFWDNDPHIDYFFYAALTNQLASGYGKSSFFLPGGEFDYYYAANLLPSFAGWLIPKVPPLDVNLFFSCAYLLFYFTVFTQITRNYFANQNSFYSLISVFFGMMLSNNMFLTNSLPFFSGQSIQNFSIYLQSLNMLLGSAFFILILKTVLSDLSKTMILKRCLLVSVLAITKLPLAIIACFIIVLYGILFQRNKKLTWSIFDSLLTSLTLVITVLLFDLGSLFSLAAARTIVEDSLLERAFLDGAVFIHPIVPLFVYMIASIFQIAFKRFSGSGPDCLLVTLSIVSCCIYLGSLFRVFPDGGSFVDHFLTPIMSICMTFLFARLLAKLSGPSVSTALLSIFCLLLYSSSAMSLNWLYYEFSLSAIQYILVLSVVLLFLQFIVVSKFATNVGAGVMLALLFSYTNPLSFYSVLDTRSNSLILDEVARSDLKNIRDIIRVEDVNQKRSVIGFSNERCPPSITFANTNISCTLQSSLVPSFLGLPSITSFESYLLLKPELERRTTKFQRMIDNCYIDNCNPMLEKFALRNSIDVIYYLQDIRNMPLLIDADLLYSGQKYSLNRLSIWEASFRN